MPSIFPVRSSWTTLLQRRISELPMPCGIEVYLFGSALRDADPADLDILLVYDPEVLTLDQFRAAGELICFDLEVRTGRAIDLCRLSVQEALSSRFIEDERAAKLFPC